MEGRRGEWLSITQARVEAEGAYTVHRLADFFGQFDIFQRSWAAGTSFRRPFATSEERDDDPESNAAATQAEDLLHMPCTNSNLASLFLSLTLAYAWSPSRSVVRPNFALPERSLKDWRW